MATRPFFSIVIPTFNRAAEIQFALFCLLRQTFTNFEIIISDNCSTDDTEKVIKKVKDKRIRYVKMKKNGVYSLNLKNALQYAQGDYIFLHSDDDFLLYENSLEKIAGKIKEKRPGYIRASYMSLTPQKNKIFFFKPNKRFFKDEYLPAKSSKSKVISFITNSDHYFITGLIFKNHVPKHIGMVTSEHAPWMDFLLYGAEHFGAYFIADPSIVALWSRWRNNPDGSHPVYSLINGKLECENYFFVVKKRIDRKSYREFLHNQLIILYINFFPLIKVKIGNKDLLKFAKRIREVDPSMITTFRYWEYLLLSLLLPRIFIKKFRDIYLPLYVFFSKVPQEKSIIKKINSLYKEYKRFMKKKGGKIAVDNSYFFPTTTILEASEGI